MSQEPLLNAQLDSRVIQMYGGMDRPPPDRSMLSNVVKTSKYNVINFLPKNIFTQFSKLANLYFAMISGMQMIPSISISDGKPVQAAPLIGVVMVSMIKDAYEDMKRHKSDRSENEQKTLKYSETEDKFVEEEWQNIQCGDICKIESDKYIPADMIILKSSDPKGVCYVETKNLDGETNMKMKTTHKELKAALINDKDVTDISGEITCERPNNAIYKFEGTMKIPSVSNQLSIGPENLLLRGSSVRNTDYVYGVVVFAGHETKVMMNSQSAKYKFSSLDGQTNTAILLILLTQLILSTCAGIIGAQWLKNANLKAMDDPNLIDTCDGAEELNKINGWCHHSEDYYLKLNAGYSIVDGVLTPEGTSSELTNPMIKKLGTWILIFTNLVPISLLVSKEMVALFQGNFMSYDVDMYDQEQDMEMRCQSSNLNEELGQVEYVFSDKTGTLTQNVMQFKKFSAGLHSYGTDNEPTGKQESNVSFEDQNLEIALKNGDEALIRTIFFLACCHTIVIDARKGTYNAASPDELALVNAAKQFGYEFSDRDEDDNIVITEIKTGAKHKYQLLNVCEFTSTRKRQSCIFRDPQGRIVLMCKGADAIIADLLSNQSKISEVFRKTQQYVDEYAKTGLRTLFLAEKYLDEQTYSEWNKKAEKAKLEVVDREDKVAAVDELIEKEMELIGSTAIEDKLQDEVADTIRFMKQTGIKVWVLTGDKIETAINIGVSAGLLDDTMDQYIVDENFTQDLSMKLQEVNNYVNQNIKSSLKKKQAIIVAGHSLVTIEEDDNLRELFLKASDNVDVVLACRVSPKQKADIVAMIRQRFPEKVTLSIGDGANDVSMILQAHVGVGILGKEGQQAARSADYAIGQFKFLKPLMFVHGREAYRRNSMLVLYSFYKNFLYVVAQFYFGFYSGFSGQPLYEKIIYQFFNITFTSFPIIWFATFDFECERDRPSDSEAQYVLPDVNKNDYRRGDENYFMRNPLLYKKGMESQCFGKMQMFKWICYGLWHAVVVYYMCFWALCIQQDGWNSPHQANGKGIEFWIAGHCVYAACCFIANLTLAHKFNIHQWYGIGLFALMIIAFPLIFGIESGWSNVVTFSNVSHIASNFWGNYLVWFGMIFSLAQVSIAEIIYNYIQHEDATYERAVYVHSVIRQQFSEHEGGQASGSSKPAGYRNSIQNHENSY